VLISFADGPFEPPA